MSTTRIPGGSGGNWPTDWLNSLRKKIVPPQSRPAAQSQAAESSRGEQRPSGRAQAPARLAVWGRSAAAPPLMVRDQATMRPPSPPDQVVFDPTPDIVVFEPGADRAASGPSDSFVAHARFPVVEASSTASTASFPVLDDRSPSAVSLTPADSANRSAENLAQAGSSRHESPSEGSARTSRSEGESDARQVADRRSVHFSEAPPTEVLVEDARPEVSPALARASTPGYSHETFAEISQDAPVMAASLIDRDRSLSASRRGTEYQPLDAGPIVRGARLPMDDGGYVTVDTADERIGTAMLNRQKHSKGDVTTRLRELLARQRGESSARPDISPAELERAMGEEGTVDAPEGSQAATALSSSEAGPSGGRPVDQK